MESITPYRITLDLNDLARISPEEQAFCFGLGQLATEIIVFQRLLLLHPKGSEVGEVERAVVVAHYVVVLRALVVRLCAAEEFLRKNQPTRGAAEWSAFVGDHLRPVRKRLAELCGKGTLLCGIRNQEAAHLDGAEIRSALATNAKWPKELIVAEDNGNSVLAVLDEALLSRHVTGKLGRESLEAVVATVMDHAFEAAKLISTLAQEALIALIELRLPDKCAEQLAPHPAADARKARLPIFVSPKNWAPAEDGDSAA